MEAKAKDEEALADRAPNNAAALTHVIAAVEFYLQAIQEATSSVDRKRFRQKCDELMAHGERLKAGANRAPVHEAALLSPMASLALHETGAGTLRPGMQYRPAPVSPRQLPKKEQIIVLKASRLNGSVFPPWEADPTDDLFSLGSPSDSLYEDDTVFSMSPQQKVVFSEWKRPVDLFEMESEESTAALMQTSQDPDLVQDITTDCSVVASLCVLVRHISRSRRDIHEDRPSLLASILHPFDHAANQPRVASSGRYIFRLYFNGTWRKVVVDDRLPASTSRTLFVVDRRNARLLWPALLEKAYLKIHGGYDFPGSNSGTDLWMITGWIPEQVFLQSNTGGDSGSSVDVDDYTGDLDRVWIAMRQAFDRGDVMITLGTGRLSAAEETHLGLAGDHDYAVLDLDEDADTGVRRMLVKNPWCANLVWRGDTSLSSPSLPSSEQDTSSSPPMTGTFWISFDDVVQYYDSIYLNWNPSLFQHRQDHHFSWTLPTKAMAHSLACNPQYTIRADADGPIWILLSRHYQDAELAIVRAKPRPASTLFSPETRQDDIEDGRGDDDAGAGYISLSVYTADGKRVLLVDRPRWLRRGPLVDAPQVLLRLDDARKGLAYTVVVAQKELPLSNYSFTLSFFSSSSSISKSPVPPLHVVPAPEMLSCQQDVAGDWSMATAGGSPASPTFVRNPQYALVVPAATPLTLLLCVEADDVPVRVDLVWARGQRVASLAMRDLVVSSGEYQRGCALAAVLPRTQPPVRRSEHDTGGIGVGSAGGVGSASFGPGVVDAGTYTVVVSTFDPGQRTRYTLRVGSAVPVTLQPIPAEDAGKFHTSLEPLQLLPPQQQQQPQSRYAADLDDHDDTTLRWQAVLAAAPSSTTPHVSLVVQAVERRTAGAGTYTATAAAAAAASTTAVRVAVERVVGAGGVGEQLAVSGSGQFQNMTAAGLRTEEVSLSRQTVSLHHANPYHQHQQHWFRILLEVRNVRHLPDVGIRVDVLSNDRIQVHPWQPL